MEVSSFITVATSVYYTAAAPFFVCLVWRSISLYQRGMKGSEVCRKTVESLEEQRKLDEALETIISKVNLHFLEAVGRNLTELQETLKQDSDPRPSRFPLYSNPYDSKRVNVKAAINRFRSRVADRTKHINEAQCKLNNLRERSETT